MRPAEAAVLGVLHGPAELLPISSSGHVAAARALTGWEVDKAGEVALHAGTVAALLVGLRWDAPRGPAFHLAAGAPAALCGYALRAAIERRLGGPRSVAVGILAGAAALAWADRAPQSRERGEAGVADGLALGLAQACALWPGVSRNGATLAAARWRGFARADANRLSREVGVPVTLGAVAFEAARMRGSSALVGAAASFASTLAALPLLRLVDSGRPLWPFAAYRAGVALTLLRGSAE